MKRSHITHITEARIFAPESDRESSSRFPSDAAVLIGTPVASWVTDRRGRPADTGVRAAKLADLLNTRVVAYQDLGPKVGIRGLAAARRRLSPEHFPEYAAQCADELRQELLAANIRQVVVRAHSGNGPLGTGLCIALPDPGQEFAVSHLAISDPVGLRKVSFLQGLKQWHRYNTGAATLTPEEHKTGRGHPGNTFKAFLADTAIRGTSTWLTDRTSSHLEHIAAQSKQTAVRLRLPGNTLNGTAEEMCLLAAGFTTMGDTHRGEGDMPFVAEFAEAEFHSSTYDNHWRNAQFIAGAVDLAPFRPGR